MQPPKILPPHYFVICVLIQIVVAWVYEPKLANHWITWVGVLPMLAGLGVAVRASIQFRKAETNIIPLTESSTLVVDGAFSFSRNPMYLGMLCFLSGLALALDAWPNWIVVLTFYLIIMRQFILKEEQLMQQTFADEYLQYQDNVRRWL